MKFHCGLAIAFMAGITVASQGNAQDEPPPVEGLQSSAVVITAEGDEAGGPPRIMSFQSVDGQGQVFSIAPAMGFGMADASVSDLMMDDQFQRELELVDSQMEDLRRIQKEMQEAMAEEMKNMRQPNGSFDPQRMQAMGEMMRRLREDADKQVKDVLLPHQQDRLKQMRRQMRMKSQGDANALTSGELAKELGLTDAQIKRLKERSAELEKEMQEEIARLKAEAKEKLLKELTKDQRKKLEALIGADFKYNRPSFGLSRPPSTQASGEAGSQSDSDRSRD